MILLFRHRIAAASRQRSMLTAPSWRLAPRLRLSRRGPAARRGAAVRHNCAERFRTLLADHPRNHACAVAALHLTMKSVMVVVKRLERFKVVCA
jgi:serine/threonine protein kinase HipA of HipAB toxin-antitoxin module